MAACLLGEQAQAKSQHPGQGGQYDQRGTAQAPLIVETHPAPKTPEEARADQEEAEHKAKNDGDIVALTGILAFIGALQLLVFGYQAYKLRETVADSKAAIAASQRSAKAAEDAVAKSDEILEHSKTVSAESNQIARDALISEHRPWVSVEADLAKVSAHTDRLEVYLKVTLANVGRSPALDVICRAKGFDKDTFDKEQRRHLTQMTIQKTHIQTINFVGDALFPGPAPEAIEIKVSIPVDVYKRGTDTTHAAVMVDVIYKFGTSIGFTRKSYYTDIDVTIINDDDLKGAYPSRQTWTTAGMGNVAQ